MYFYFNYYCQLDDVNAVISEIHIMKSYSGLKSILAYPVSVCHLKQTDEES